MWQVFAALRKNGIEPNDQKAQNLYLRLAKEVIRTSGDLVEVNAKRFF